MGHIREENLLKKGAYLRPIENIFCCCLVSGFKCHFQTCCVFRNTALAFLRITPFGVQEGIGEHPFVTNQKTFLFLGG